MYVKPDLCLNKSVFILTTVNNSKKLKQNKILEQTSGKSCSVLPPVYKGKALLSLHCCILFLMCCHQRMRQTMLRVRLKGRSTDT